MNDEIRFPQAAPGRRIERFRSELEPALQRVLASGRYILGPAVEQFEQSFSIYLGARHTIAVNSGTDALELALRALGIGPGDEVVTTSMTASGTGVAIAATGATLRYADIDPATFCIDPRAIAGAVTPRTAAIVPVHLYGHPCDMAGIMDIASRRGLKVVEDCAQAHGARIDGRLVGTFGHAAAFSFYPTKNLGGVGDGGAVVTNDAGVAASVRAMRQYGWRGQDRSSSQFGLNSRLDELQAGVLCTLLPHLDPSNAERRAIAAIYREKFTAVAAAGRIVLPPSAPGAVHHQFAVGVRERAKVAAGLAKRGIGTQIHYAVPLHRQAALASPHVAPLPYTEALAETTLSLPIQPEVVGNAAAEIADLVLQELPK